MFYRRARLLVDDVTENLKVYFSGIDSVMSHLYQTLKDNGVFAKENAIEFSEKKIWLEEVSKGVYGICIESVDEAHNFLFIVKTCKRGEIDFSCFRYFSDWHENILDHPHEEYIVHAEKYFCKTDASDEYVKRPNLQFFKDNSVELLKEKENRETFLFEELFSMIGINKGFLKRFKAPKTFTFFIDNGYSLTFVDCLEFLAHFSSIDKACNFAVEALEQMKNEERKTI